MVLGVFMVFWVLMGFEALAKRAAVRNWSFLLLLHDPCHRTPLSARIWLPVIAPYCWALLNCHMSLFERWIFLIYAAAAVVWRSQQHCILPSSTALILMSVYCIAVKESFLTISHGINRHIFFPIYNEARAKAYTVKNITAAFKVTRIFSLEFSSSQPAFETYCQKPQRIPGWYHLYTWKHSLHQARPSVANSVRSRIY